MKFEQRLSRLEAEVKAFSFGCDLFDQMRRYEEIYEATEAGLPLDREDPDVQTCMKYESYFEELEAQRLRCEQ